MPPIDPAAKEFVGSTCRNAGATRDWTRLAKAALKVYSVADRHVANCQAAEPEVQLACREGCAYCCHRLVRASLPEVLAAMTYVKEEWSPEEVDRFVGRAQEAESLDGPFWRDESTRTNSACPFLIDDRCSIYSLRPLACRGANSTDPEACRDFYTGGQLNSPTALPDQEAVSQLSSIAGEGCQRAGLISGLFDFGAAVSLALQEPNLLENLEGRLTGWERVKLFSDWTTNTTPAPLRANEMFGGPAARELVTFAREGNAEELHRALEKFDQGPVKALMSLTLPGQYLTQESLETWWEGLDSHLSAFEEFEGQDHDLYEGLHFFNTFNWAYTGKNIRPYMERLMARVHKAALKSVPHLSAPITAARRAGKFRIGYVSPRLKSFNGARWALGTLREHSDDFETFAFNLADAEDATSLAFRRAADHYVHCPMPAIQAAEIIRSLDLDALVFTDVGMCGRSLQLASLRLARRQFTGWGHPVTSGSPTMDAYLSSEWMEPEDGDDHYSEQLVRLPKCGLSTSFRPAEPSDRSAASLGVPDTGFLLYCQIPNKHIPAHDALFRRVIDESPKPLVIIGGADRASQRPLKVRLGERNTIFLDVLPRPDYLRLIQLADATIESPSFGGGFTAIDSLAVGTPAVTLPGEFMRGRLSLGFLRQCGLENLIAQDKDAFVRLTTRQAPEVELLVGTRLFDNHDARMKFEQVLLARQS